jgi:regulation of enolase protein 1 (concanavalin A-like superfamily)
MVIPFGSATNPYQLNPAFHWRQGGSTYSSVILSQVSPAVIITGGPNADSWQDKDQMPLLLYSISGDFDAQVKLDFSPKSCGTAAGIGVRSATDNLTWLRFIRGCIDVPAVASIAVDSDNHGVAGRPTSPVNFSFPNSAYLRIQRRGGSSFTFSYSANGNDWTSLLSDFLFQMPASAEIFVTAVSWGSESAQAYFDDFRVAGR